MDQKASHLLPHFDTITLDDAANEARDYPLAPNEDKVTVESAHPFESRRFGTMLETQSIDANPPFAVVYDHTTGGMAEAAVDGGQAGVVGQEDSRRIVAFVGTPALAEDRNHPLEPSKDEVIIPPSTDSSRFGTMLEKHSIDAVPPFAVVDDDDTTGDMVEAAVDTKMLHRIFGAG